MKPYGVGRSLRRTKRIDIDYCNPICGKRLTGQIGVHAVFVSTEYLNKLHEADVVSVIEYSGVIIRDTSVTESFAQISLADFKKK